ncbi:hypothetical protein BC939DRAFT_506057 [Gamsiella multidivaricata]|uniref:uncharacterized protein n=1 Tax=Gamsiella multidivaricata TaxID=101098 RepID=UPI00221FDFED|nr:uncharacterized protein BC939DRAFT_506057 [Gamsiella multidivaricata]KAI7819096.1 hypothetical protein BC939DRAFT_506057 [Gamsiella multidivaricata]
MMESSSSSSVSGIKTRRSLSCFEAMSSNKDVKLALMFLEFASGVCRRNSGLPSWWNREVTSSMITQSMLFALWYDSLLGQVISLIALETHLFLELFHLDVDAMIQQVDITVNIIAVSVGVAAVVSSVVAGYIAVAVIVIATTRIQLRPITARLNHV